MPRLGDFRAGERIANLDRLAESLLPGAGRSARGGPAVADLISVFPVCILGQRLAGPQLAPQLMGCAQS